MEGFLELEKIFGKGYLVSSNKEEYEYTCPKCSEFRHLHISYSKGVYTCVTPGCNYRGSLKYLLSKNFPEVFYNTPNYIEVIPDWDLMSKICEVIVDKGNLLDSHKYLLEKRGILPDKFLSSNNLINILLKYFDKKDLYTCGFINKNNIVEVVLKPDRIIIPYLAFDNKCYYIRSRDTVKDSLIRYASPSRFPGKDVNWGWECIEEETSYVILTEGEFKAQAAQQLGFQCVAIPGINIGYQTFLEVVLEKQIKEVYLLFDTENKINSIGISKQKNIEICENKITKLLKKNSIEVYVCRFQTEKEKMDIDQFILESKNPQKELLEILKGGEKQ